MRGSAAAILVLVLLAASSLIAFTPVSAAYPGSWTSKAPMHQARGGLGVAVVNGKIYAMGGFVENGVVTGVNEKYDPESDTWTFRSSMPTPRAHFATAVFANKVYCIGGVGGGGVNEVYDPATDMWENKTSMPTARGYITANVVDGRIYIIGGDSNGTINEVYDPTTDSWTTKASMPTGSYGYASAVVDNKIYIMDSNLNQIYNVETNTWSLGASPPSRIGYGKAGVTTGENALKRIYVFSSMYWEPTQFNQVYDPQHDRWTLGAAVPTNRLSFAVAVVNDRLYAIGGISVKYVGFDRQAATGEMYEDTFYATNEQYTPLGYGSPDPSYDGAAPEFSVVSPGNETYFTEGAGLNFTDVALNFTVDEPVFSVHYVLDGGVPVEVSGNATLAELPIGAHNVTVFGFDASGNMGASETVCFAVAEPEPFPVVLVATASGASAAIIGIALLVYFRRRSHRAERLVKKS